MPTLSWNEIRQHAIQFSRDWKDTTDDRAVDKCYRTKKFQNERERIEHLFELYEQITVVPPPFLPSGQSALSRHSRAKAEPADPPEAKQQPLFPDPTHPITL